MAAPSERKGLSEARWCECLKSARVVVFFLFFFYCSVRKPVFRAVFISSPNQHSVWKHCWKCEACEADRGGHLLTAATHNKCLNPTLLVNTLSTKQRVAFVFLERRRMPRLLKEAGLVMELHWWTEELFSSFWCFCDTNTTRFGSKWAMGPRAGVGARPTQVSFTHANCNRLMVQHLSLLQISSVLLKKPEEI